jgi:AcrR family transcriptional regulator
MAGESGHSMSTREGGSLRERKRAAAQARVVDVAIELFAARGFGDVSVAEICAAAEVSERSFFRWFAAKEEVVMEPMREMADRVEQAISAAPARLDDHATVELGLRALADWMLADWERLTVYFRVWLDDMRAGEVADPHAHLDTIFAAR